MICLSLSVIIFDNIDIMRVFVILMLAVLRNFPMGHELHYNSGSTALNKITHPMLRTILIGPGIGVSQRDQWG